MAEKDKDRYQKEFSEMKENGHYFNQDGVKCDGHVNKTKNKSTKQKSKKQKSSCNTAVL